MLLRIFLPIYLLFMLGFFYTIHSAFKPMLWKITGNSLSAPSYLFGTYHSRDESINKLAHVVYEKLHTSHRLYTEIKLDTKDHAQIQRLLKLPKPINLHERFNQTTLNAIHHYLNKHKIVLTLSDLSVYKTWAIALILSNSAESNKTNHSKFMDERLIALVKPKAKPHYALESPLEQLQHFDAMNQTAKLTFLDTTLKSNPKQEQQTLSSWYVKGDLEGFHALKGTLDTSALEPLFAGLLDVRNRTLFLRINKALTTHPTLSNFFAIGVGHLAGTDGVLARLKKAGYTLKQLD